MTIQTQPTLDRYRDQIQRCVQAMALGYVEDVRPFLSRGGAIESVKMFVDDNVEKRLGKLIDQVELLKPAFDDLDRRIEEFIHEVPLAAYDTGCSDGDRFLRWLGLNDDLTLEQLDHVACQSARHEVELIARNNRLGHVRFQELWRLVPTLRNELESNPKLRLLLNPIRAWVRFQTDVLVGEEVELPAEALLFACGNQVRTSVFEEVGRQHIETLASHGPFTLSDWKRQERSVSRNDLIEFCLDAAEMGLVAFG